MALTSKKLHMHFAAKPTTTPKQLLFWLKYHMYNVYLFEAELIAVINQMYIS